MSNSLIIASITVAGILLAGSSLALLTAWFVVRTLLIALIGR